MTSKPLHLGFFYTPHGAHPGGPRHPNGGHDPFDPAQITSIAQRAETAGFGFIHFADRLNPDPKAAAGNPDALARTEAFTTASFLATRTQRLGFIVTGNTSYSEPFNLARLTSSLDHVTHGRAGWDVTTGASRAAAHNHSQAEVSAADHYERAAEVVEIARKLWDSWEDEAFIRNRETGEYVDGSKIHPINHEGRRFRVKGPLNVARPPQGQLVVAHEISSDLSYGLAAAQADVVFLGAHPPEELRRRNEALGEALRAAGRSPAEVRTFAEITPIIDATPSEAQALLNELTALAGGPPAGARYLVGDAIQIADQIEALVEASGVDGITVRLAVLPQQLDAFADLVAPELERRGRLARLSGGVTLRDQLHLSRPANRFAAA